MTPRIFLSVDIDFWNSKRPAVAAGVAAAYLDEVTALARRRGIPVSAVMNHQQMLPLANHSGANTLVNIDTHSDLAEKHIDSFSCGTWIGYVAWRKRGEYHWIHRNAAHEGECASGRGPENIFTYSTGVPNRARREPVAHLTDWGRVKRTRMPVAPEPRTLIPATVHLSVALSPGYCDPSLEPVFRAWVKRWNVEYRKGLREENCYHF